MTNRFHIAGFAIALMGLPLAVNASVLINYDSTATRPGSGQILSTLNPDNIATGATIGSYTWRRNQATVSNNWNRAISFHANASGTLDELGIYLTSAGGGGGGNEFQIVIREYTSAPTSPVSGTLLLTTTATVNVSGGSDGILKFAFSGTDVVNITNGNWYTVSLVWTSDWDSSMNFSLRDSSSGVDSSGYTVSAGSWRANPGGSWVAQGANNVLFYAATSQAIPEPSAYVLFSLAAAGGVLYLRRRNG